MKDPRELHGKYTEQDMRERRDALLRQEAEKVMNRKERRKLKAKERKNDPR